MKNFLFASGLVLIMMIAGCANSPPTRFYMLSSTPDIREMPGKTDNSCPTIGVGPIEIPQYLARAQIATAASENEISYAEFDQWAQPLPGNFSHVIAENLSRLACTRAVYKFPWTWPEILTTVSGWTFSLWRETPEGRRLSMPGGQFLRRRRKR